MRRKGDIEAIFMPVFIAGLFSALSNASAYASPTTKCDFSNIFDPL